MYYSAKKHTLCSFYWCT